MSIRRISELDRLPSSYFFTDSTYTKLNDKFKRALLEISEWDGEHNDSPSFYVSKAISGDFIISAINSEVSNFFENNNINKMKVRNVSVFNLDLGDPNSTHTDSRGHTVSVDNRYDHKLKCYVKADFNNEVYFHNNVEFHDGINVWKYAKFNCDIDASGYDIYCNVLHGTATAARWADLAEMYESDKVYEPGTIVKFGGEKEITIATDKANGVITTKPGLILNSDNSSKNMLGIALVGRVPIKVKGKVNKFDNIVLSEDEPGVGIVDNLNKQNIIGKALESSDNDNIKLIECVTKFRLV